MAKKNEVVGTNATTIQPIGEIGNLIVDIRGRQVMLDRDLAMLYGVETKRLNEQVRRNLERFPEHFRFQLNDYEKDELVANCDRLRNLKHSSVNPFVFTEQGVAMLSTVLHSETAVRTSIQIMDAFTAMRHFIGSHAQMFQRMEIMERNQLAIAAHLTDNDRKIEEVFERLYKREEEHQKEIFYDGQFFDAYTLIADLIKQAQKRIILFDNYIDESVLYLLDKRNTGVTATVYTKHIDAHLQTDIAHHDAQYPHIDVQLFQKSHDRFLCIDNTVYFVGASIKDIGKRWFAFGRMEQTTDDLLSRM